MPDTWPTDPEAYVEDVFDGHTPDWLKKGDAKNPPKPVVPTCTSCGCGRDDHSEAFTDSPCLSCGECWFYVGTRPIPPVKPIPRYI
jgi:hypothetical protein